MQMHRSLGMVADGRCTILFECRLVQRTKSPNPSLRLQAIVEEFFRHIYFLKQILHIIIIRIEPIVICTELTKEIRA